MEKVTGKSNIALNPKEVCSNKLLPFSLQWQELLSRVSQLLFDQQLAEDSDLTDIFGCQTVPKQKVENDKSSEQNHQNFSATRLKSETLHNAEVFPFSLTLKEAPPELTYSLSTFPQIKWNILRCLNFLCSSWTTMWTARTRRLNEAQLFSRKCILCLNKATGRVFLRETPGPPPRRTWACDGQLWLQAVRRWPWCCLQCFCSD